MLRRRDMHSKSAVDGTTNNYQLDERPNGANTPEKLQHSPRMHGDTHEQPVPDEWRSKRDGGTTRLTRHPPRWSSSTHSLPIRETVGRVGASPPTTRRAASRSAIHRASSMAQCQPHRPPCADRRISGRGALPTGEQSGTRFTLMSIASSEPVTGRRGDARTQRLVAPVEIILTTTNTN